MPLQLGDKLPELGYELVELIREGGHASVYRATHPKLSTKAVKILKPGMLPDIVEGFMREGQLLDKFDSPHIIRGYHSLKIGAEYVIVMQYADGGSLRDLLDKQRMPIADVIKLTRAIGLAVDYAHRLGVLLLDINPANILRVGNKWVLSDLGIAVYDAPDLVLPSAHGTPGYLAPEIWARKPVRASDLFALGCVVYEALCGQPIDFGSVQDLLGPNPAPRLPLDPAIPDDVAEVLAQVLEKDPANRFGSAAEFVEEFRASFAGRRKVVKTATARPSTIQVNKVAHIGASGRPRCITFNDNGRLLLCTVGKSLSGYNTLTRLYLQGQASRGVNFNDAITQIEFIDQTQAWVLCEGMLYLVKFDKLATGRGSDEIVLSNAVITAKQSDVLHARHMMLFLRPVLALPCGCIHCEVIGSASCGLRTVCPMSKLK